MLLFILTSTTRFYDGVGCLTPLTPHYNINGFQRMTMMKFFTNDDGTPVMSSLWAYEGVVVPGGNVMLGRWWRALWDPSQPHPPPSPLGVRMTLC